MDSLVNLDNKSTLHLSASKTISTYLVDREIKKEKENKKKAAAEEAANLKKKNGGTGKIFSKTMPRKTISYMPKKY